MKISEQKILYSPSDLNNFISCKYHIRNDLVAKELNLKKREITADIELWRKYGDEHEAKYLTFFLQYIFLNFRVQILVLPYLV